MRDIGYGGAAELRRALRGLRRSPGYAALVSVTLAVGIGATTTMLTILDQVVLRPLPVIDQDEVVVAWGDHRPSDVPHYPISYRAYRQVRDQSRTLSQVAAVGRWGAFQQLLEDEGRLSSVRVSETMGDFFGVLGVVPAAGRTLAADDDIAGGPRNAVISHGFWLRNWGGSPSAVGSTLTIDGVDFSVVGVLPEGFDYPTGSDLWRATLPRFPDQATVETTPFIELDLVGRMVLGSSPASVAQEIDALLAGDTDLQRTYADVDAVVRTLPEVVLGNLRPVLIVLLGAALLVLCVALLNVANLVSVRAAEREVALAVRRALGADVRRLARAALAEAVVLATVAGTLALLLTVAALRWALPFAPAELSRLAQVELDAPTFLYGLALTVMLVPFLTLLPLAGLNRLETAKLLRAGPRSTGMRASHRRSVLAVQAALALWAVAAAALMLRTLENLQGLELGFDPDGLSMVALSHQYSPGQLPEGLADQLQAVVDRVEAHPGVQAATPVLAPPLVGGGGYDAVVQLEGQTREDMRTNPYLNWEIVLPGYFQTMDVALVSGRALTAQDGPSDPLAVVVNEATAQALWPGQNAVGKQVGAFGSADAQVWWTVVGVVADMRYRELLEPRPSIYFPFQQRPIVAPGQLLVRTAGPVDLLPVVSAAFAEAAPAFRAVSASSLGRRLESPLARPRLSLVVLGIFAALVLLLSAVGVYGVTSASVRARVREMGVRLACGAAPATVATLVLRQSVGVVAMGVAAGVVAALATGRLLGALLFGVEPSDPASLLGSTLLVLLAAVAATAAPAIRAAMTDPARVLRED